MVSTNVHVAPPFIAYEYIVAWRVDFNLALVSFEPNILEATYLLNFARENRIRFIFTSSVGVFASRLIPQSSNDTFDQ